RGTHGRPRGRNEHLVGPAIWRRGQGYADPLQGAYGLSNRAVGYDIAAPRHYVPRVNFLCPRRHPFGVLAHELLDTLLECLDRSPHLGTDFVVLFAADFLVPHHAHCQVIPEPSGANDFGYRTGGAAVVFEQLFQTVFCLCIADGIRGRLEGRREDVWNSVFVAVNGRRAIGRGFIRQGPGCGRGNEWTSNDDDNKCYDGPFHGFLPPGRWAPGCAPMLAEKMGLRTDDIPRA